MVVQVQPTPGAGVRETAQDEELGAGTVGHRRGKVAGGSHCQTGLAGMRNTAKRPICRQRRSTNGFSVFPGPAE